MTRNPWLILAATLALAVPGYIGSCWWWPWAHCWRCDGRGKHGRADEKVWRACRRCSGSGRRMRVGRRVWGWLATRRRDE